MAKPTQSPGQESPLVKSFQASFWGLSRVTPRKWMGGTGEDMPSATFMVRRQGARMDGWVMPPGCHLQFQGWVRLAVLRGLRNVFPPTCPPDAQLYLLVQRSLRRGTAGTDVDQAGLRKLRELNEERPGRKDRCIKREGRCQRKALAQSSGKWEQGRPWHLEPALTVTDGPFILGWM